MIFFLWLMLNTFKTSIGIVTTIHDGIVLTIRRGTSVFYNVFGIFLLIVRTCQWSKLKVLNSRHLL